MSIDYTLQGSRPVLWRPATVKDPSTFHPRFARRFAWPPFPSRAELPSPSLDCLRWRFPRLGPSHEESHSCRRH